MRNIFWGIVLLIHEIDKGQFVKNDWLETERNKVQKYEFYELMEINWKRSERKKRNAKTAV